MTKKEILSAFLQAEKDWEINMHSIGLCYYFDREQRLGRKNTLELQLYWIKYKTTSKGCMYHFHNRKERLQAIRNVIKDLEYELGITH